MMQGVVITGYESNGGMVAVWARQATCEFVKPEKTARWDYQQA